MISFGRISSEGVQNKCETIAQMKSWTKYFNHSNQQNQLLILHFVHWTYSMLKLHTNSLQTIFSFLPIVDLSACSYVNTRWKKISTAYFCGNHPVYTNQIKLKFLRKVREWIIIFCVSLPKQGPKEIDAVVNHLQQHYQCFLLENMDDQSRIEQCFPKLYPLAHIISR